MKTFNAAKYFFFLFVIGLILHSRQTEAKGFVFYFKAIEIPRGPNSFLEAIEPGLRRIGRPSINRAQALSLISRQFETRGDLEVVESILVDRENNPSVIADLQRPVPDVIEAHLRGLSRRGHTPVEIAQGFFRSAYYGRPEKPFSLYLNPPRNPGGTISALAKLLNITVFLWMPSSNGEGVVFVGALNLGAAGERVHEGIHILFAERATSRATLNANHFHALDLVKIGMIEPRSEENPLLTGEIHGLITEGPTPNLFGGMGDLTAADPERAVTAAAAAGRMSLGAEEARKEGALAESGLASGGSARVTRAETQRRESQESAEFTMSKAYEIHVQALGRSLSSYSGPVQKEILTYFARMSPAQQEAYFSTGILTDAPPVLSRFLETLIASPDPSRVFHLAGLMRLGEQSPWQLRWVHKNGINSFIYAMRASPRRKYTRELIAKAWQVMQLAEHLKIEVQAFEEGPVLNTWSIANPDRFILIINKTELFRRVDLGGMIDRATFETFEKWYDFFSTRLTEAHIKQVLKRINGSRFYSQIATLRGEALFSQLAFMVTFLEIQGADFSASANEMGPQLAPEGILFELALVDRRQEEIDQVEALQVQETERFLGAEELARRKIARAADAVWESGPLAEALRVGKAFKAKVRREAGTARRFVEDRLGLIAAEDKARDGLVGSEREGLARIHSTETRERANVAERITKREQGEKQEQQKLTERLAREAEKAVRKTLTEEEQARARFSRAENFGWVALTSMAAAGTLAFSVERPSQVATQTDASGGVAQLNLLSSEDRVSEATQTLSPGTQEGVFSLRLRASAAPFTAKFQRELQVESEHLIALRQRLEAFPSPHVAWELVSQQILSLLPQPYPSPHRMISIANRNTWTDLLLRSIFLGALRLPQDFFVFNGLVEEDLLKLSMGVPLAFDNADQYEIFNRAIREILPEETVLIQGTAVTLFSRNPTKPYAWAFHNAGSPASHHVLLRTFDSYLCHEPGNGHASDLDVVIIRPDLEYPEERDNLIDVESQKILSALLKERFGESAEGESIEYAGFKYEPALKAWTHPSAKSRQIPIKILFHKVPPAGGWWSVQ